eukprot:753420-Hanusia_phi.AAC.1
MNRDSLARARRRAQRRGRSTVTLSVRTSASMRFGRRFFTLNHSRPRVPEGPFTVALPRPILTERHWQGASEWAGGRGPAGRFRSMAALLCIEELGRLHGELEVDCILRVRSRVLSDRRTCTRRGIHR